MGYSSENMIDFLFLFLHENLRVFRCLIAGDITAESPIKTVITENVVQLV